MFGVEREQLFCCMEPRVLASFARVQQAQKLCGTATAAKQVRVIHHRRGEWPALGGNSCSGSDTGMPAAAPTSAADDGVVSAVARPA